MNQWGDDLAEDDSRPIFVQVAELIENSVVDGSLAEESQVPSTNELAAFHRINCRPVGSSASCRAGCCPRSASPSAWPRGRR